MLPFLGNALSRCLLFYHRRRGVGCETEKSLMVAPFPSPSPSLTRFFPQPDIRNQGCVWLGEKPGKRDLAGLLRDFWRKPAPSPEASRWVEFRYWDNRAPCISRLGSDRTRVERGQLRNGRRSIEGYGPSPLPPYTNSAFQPFFSPNVWASSCRLASATPRSRT